MARKRFLEIEDEQQMIVNEMARETKMSILPGNRLMAVMTQRGTGYYEYVSVRTGKRVGTKRGNWYYQEVRYPISQAGELKPRKKGGLPPDSRAYEEMGYSGIPEEERTVETYVELLRRKRSI